MEIKFDFLKTRKGTTPENRCEVRENHIIIKPPEKNAPDHVHWQFKIGIGKNLPQNKATEVSLSNDAEAKDKESV